MRPAPLDRAMPTESETVRFIDTRLTEPLRELEARRRPAAEALKHVERRTKIIAWVAVGAATLVAGPFGFVLSALRARLKHGVMAPLVAIRPRRPHSAARFRREPALPGTQRVLRGTAEILHRRRPKAALLPTQATASARPPRPTTTSCPATARTLPKAARTTAAWCWSVS